MGIDSAAWLRECFPAIAPSTGWDGDACWVAWAMTRSPEHDPPVYWLGRALHAVTRGGVGDRVRDRLVAAHGERNCGGDPALDDAAQDVLSEACAWAWAAAHLGAPRVEPAAAGASAEAGPVHLHVPALDARIAPHRLAPQRSLEGAIAAMGALMEQAARALPPARGRIVYLDLWHDARYAQSVGYRLELTEPLRHAIGHFAAEHGVGYVLTRPFQWGNPIEAEY